MTQPRTPQFGAILFRASELIGQQGAEVFDRLGVGIEARVISIVLTIHAHGPLSSSELAERIGISRQLIESRLKSSVSDGFFVSHQEPGDSRKRVYEFSDQARPIVDRVVSIMLDFEQIYEQLWKELGVDLEQSLKAMERALANKSLTTRLCDEYQAYSRQILEVEG